ncbi:MAG: M20 family metallopeptidase [Gammaproteobacteria bacterium]
MKPAVAGAVITWLHRHHRDMIALIERLAALETPSDVAESQQPLLDLLAETFTGIGYRVRRIAGKNSGGHLLALPCRRVKRGPLQLLLGHCDTVWPLGTLEHMPIKSEHTTLYGPGIYDMKTGLVQIVFALSVLQELNLEPTVAPVVFVNSDEEIGSRESTVYIRRLARLADRSLVLEPSLGKEGCLKTARKGVGRFSVTVKGKAAHAGLNPEQGISAILELSHVIQKLFRLNDAERGISVNVGTIDGGLRTNVVAPTSRATVDVRVLTESDAEAVTQAILAIEPTLPGIELEIEGGIGRPPLEKTPANRKLWLLASDLARELGFELQEATAGGGSDGNTSSLYSATLDGLGAVGDGAHARHEQIDLSRLPERTALLSLLLLAPASAQRVSVS